MKCAMNSVQLLRYNDMSFFPQWIVYVFIIYQQNTFVPL